MSRLFDLDPPEAGMNMQENEEKDLSPFHDGGIIKTLKHPGHGNDYPNAGDTVTLRYVAYFGEIAPEYIFDSSERDRKNFTYEVCRGIHFFKQYIFRFLVFQTVMSLELGWVENLHQGTCDYVMGNTLRY